MPPAKLRMLPFYLSLLDPGFGPSDLPNPRDVPVKSQLKEFVNDYNRIRYDDQFEPITPENVRVLGTVEYTGTADTSKGWAYAFLSNKARALYPDAMALVNPVTKISGKWYQQKKNRQMTVSAAVVCVGSKPSLLEQKVEPEAAPA